jgi:hypothetical protein
VFPGAKPDLADVVRVNFHHDGLRSGIEPGDARE